MMWLNWSFVGICLAAYLAAGLFFVARTVDELHAWNTVPQDMYGLAAVALAWLPIAILNVISCWKHREPYGARGLPRGYIAAPLSLMVVALLYAAAC